MTAPVSALHRDNASNFSALAGFEVPREASL
jgi:hypothetical protein